MFLVFESIAWGMEHVSYNAALLKTIRLAFPNESISFYGEDAHLGLVRKQGDKEFAASIAWRKMVLPPRQSGFYGRLRSDFRNVKFLLNELNENPRQDILVITGNASILWALKHYVRTIHKDKKIQTIIHGDFSTLHRIPRRGLLNPFYYPGSLKIALKRTGYESLQHIVLEKAVRDAIVENMPFLRDNVFVLELPVPIDDHRIEITDSTPPFHFGFLGRATEQKGFSTYLAVASEILQRFPGKAKFHLVGRISDRQKRTIRSKLGFLDETPGMERMSRNEYLKRLMKLHFVCLFYNQYYRDCASGVFLDSIASGKPIIATKLPIFTNIQKRFGDIGYLCLSNEITETISHIIQTNDTDRYKRQVFNIEQVKASRTPEALAPKYLKLVNFL